MAITGARKRVARGKTPAAPARYSAPALEKGLDILEFLAEHADGGTLADIASGIARTKGEIFRMLAALEARRYIARDTADERYRITDKLFRLGLRQPKYRALVETASPFMDAFADATRYPCHLAIPTGDQIAVIARAESNELVGIAVKVGYRQSLLDTGSGMCLLAFMSGEDSARAFGLLRVARRKIPDALKNELARIAKSGAVIEPSRIMEGVWDISCPVLHDGKAIAALTVPYVKLKNNTTSRETIAKRLADTAARISVALGKEA
ncbi:MAG: IclR family transcriptional regulator [Parvibaculum sp.]|uniref:IclR family transcriptional regulator n=1 Tax=Parvibaculum sp. TaxID=2024848 RepID=UPI0025FCE814|nr:IclR family transcriptional regulator [Parvibaculum sp.]MCE9648465.1 IclR family transcriptional regulator [Parvibaculum sp.]